MQSIAYVACRTLRVYNVGLLENSMINLSEDSLAWIEAIKVLQNDMTEDRLLELMDADGIPEPEQQEVVKALRSLA